MADSLLMDAAKTAGNVGVGGLAAAGNLLGLPGSMIRDVLALRNPFDQLLTPFGGQNRTEGRDLLRRWGLAKPKDTWGNWGAGFLVDIATDPFTYTGLPGVSKASTTAGKAFEKAGGLMDDITRVATKNAGKGIEATKTLGASAKMNTTLRHMLEDAASQGAEHADELTKGLETALSGTGKALADVMDEPLGGLMEYGLPFMKKTMVLPKTHGDWVQKTADVLDTAWDHARFSPYSPISHLEPLFNNSVNGGLTKLDKIIGARATRSAARNAAKAAGKVYDAQRAVHDSGILDEAAQTNLPPGMTARDVVLKNSNDMRNWVENASMGPHMPPEALRTPIGDSGKSIAEHLNELQRMQQQSLVDGAGVGTKAAELADQQEGILNYLSRQKNFVDDPKKGFWDKFFGREMAIPTNNPHNTQRDQLLTGFTGGTGDLQRMSVDPVISGAKRAMTGPGPLDQSIIDAGADYITKNYPNALPPAASGIDPAERAAQLSKYFGELNPAYADTKTPLFSVNPIDDIASQLRHSGRANSNLEHIFSLLEDGLQHGKTGVDGVSLDSLLTRPGVDKAMASKALAGRPLLEGMNQKILLNHLGMSGANNAQYAQAFLNRLKSSGQKAGDILNRLGVPSASDDMKTMFVPKEHADAITRVLGKFDAPQEANVILDGIDRLTRATKAHLTSLFPSFHTRNALGGATQAFMGDAYDASAGKGMGYLKPRFDAESLMRGEDMKGAASLPWAKMQGYTDDHAASEGLRKMIYEQGVIGNGQGMGIEDTADALQGFASSVPGIRPDGLDFSTLENAGKSIKNIVKEGIPKSLADASPLNIEGVGVNKTTNTAVKAGGKVGQHIEGTNRIGTLLGYLSQGYSPEAAANLVKKYNVDYAALTPFEKTWMRRMFPFYSFTKGTAKQVLTDLAEKPGGKLAQTIRLTNKLKGDDPTTPDYVNDTLAIPLGENSDGSKRYITGFGLAHEDPLSFLGGGLRGAGLEALSRLNPVVKAPMEYSTGQTFFQKEPGGGRSLADADPTLGRLMANLTGREKAVRYPGDQLAEVVLSNSPVSRILSTARQVTDPRKSLATKGVNLLTGARVSDISPGAQDAVLRDKIETVLRDYPEARRYVKTFVSKEQLDQMDPKRRAKVESMTAMLNDLAKRASSRAKAKKAAAQ